MSRARILLAVTSLLLATGLVLAYTGALAATVTVSWSYDYTRQPACSASRPRDCIDHFEVLDYTNGQNPKLLSTVPNPENAFGTVDKIAATFVYGPPFGRRTIVVVAVARQTDGTLVNSNPYAARQDVEITPKMRNKR